MAKRVHHTLAEKAKILKELRKKDRPRGGEIVVVDHVVMMHEQASKNRRAAGGAQGGGDKGVGEMGAAGGESVELGSLQEGMVKKTDGIVAMVIGQDEDDVPGARAFDPLQLEILPVVLAESRPRQRERQHCHYDKKASAQMPQGILLLISISFKINHPPDRKTHSSGPASGPPIVLPPHHRIKPLVRPSRQGAVTFRLGL